MLSDGWDLGIVTAKRARDARIAAANPRHARRILGRPLPKPATITTSVTLAKKPKSSGRTGPPFKHPWTTMEVGQFFDVPMDRMDRRSMGKQARIAFKKYRRRFGVALAVNRAGIGVIRVTRLT